MSGPREGARSQRAGQAVALGLLFAAGVVNFFDRTALSVANTTVAGELHLSATAMGWLLSAFSLAYGVAQLPLVAVLRRVSTRAVLGVGLAVWSLAQVLTGFVRGMGSFAAMRVLLGAGESPFYPCGVAVVREWFPERTRGRATAAMSMSQTLGLAAAPPVLTAAMLRFGWRVMFASLGVAGLAVAAAWWGLYRANVNPREEVEQFRGDEGSERMFHVEHSSVGESSKVFHVEHSSEGAGAQVFHVEHSVMGEEPKVFHVEHSVWGQMLRSRTVWGMMLGFGGINYTNWMYTAWLPGYLQAVRHVSVSKAGWLAAVPFLAGAAGMLSSGAVTDALRGRGVRLARVHRANLVVGMVLSAASTWFVAGSRSTAGAVAGISAALFCIHFAGTSGWGYVQVVARAGEVASLGALQNFASFLIASVAPVLTGSLWDRTHSFRLALLVCTAVTLCGALSYATLGATLAASFAAPPE